MPWEGVESGTILVPNGQSPKLREALNAAHAVHVSDVRDEVTRIWNQVLRPLPVKDRVRYMCPVTGAYVRDTKTSMSVEVLADVLRVFSETSSRPSKKNYADCGLSYGTNRTTLWRSTSAQARLSGRELSWSAKPTSEDGCDPFGQWLAPALFGFLEKLCWVDGSGGVILGSDSLNNEISYTLDPVNYTVAEFGPGKPNRHILSGTDRSEGWAPRLVLPG